MMVTINPAGTHFCDGCDNRWADRLMGVLICSLGFEIGGRKESPRPAACIAAEAEVTKLAKDAEWACENRVQLCDVEGCDAEVTCGWPTGGGYRQTCSRHYLDGLSFMAAPRQPEKRDRVADALAAVCGPEPVEL